MSIENLSSSKSFNGWHKQYTHHSSVLNCDMRFAIYLPLQATNENKVPVLYWLSGLTCTDENFMQKAGAHRLASELGIAIVAPDTSPRGDSVPDADTYDLGQGAGFYINATQSPWSKHYHMYDYIVNELPEIVESVFPVNKQRAIAGHSMGGHGALVIALRNPRLYSSVSAFSPISNPINSPWGQKAFKEYLGEDRALWKSYDACELLKVVDQHTPMLVDQGMADEFLLDQLKPDTLDITAREKRYPITLRQHVGYDHSYYFIASFIEDHLRFHKSNF